MRRAFQRHSVRLMGSKLDISSWRQCSIAIAKRYLRRGFGVRLDTVRGQHHSPYDAEDDAEDDEDGGEDGGEAGGVPDRFWALQATHGEKVESHIYGRGAELGLFETSTQQDRFRTVSCQWHRFLGFPSASDPKQAQLSASLRLGAQPYDEMWEASRLQRLQWLARVDLDAQLCQFTGTPTASFRPGQRPVLQAIVRGESPIVQVASTGGGKSLSFLLPAFCAPEGTTIVVVPLVSLREDLKRRCTEAGIHFSVWQGASYGQGPQPPQSASLVFVTPESAVTKGFRSFINRLRGRQQLDRVVVDECHCVLQSSPSFRPRLAQLGEAVSLFGVQLVFLTATLPPYEEPLLYQALGLAPQRVRLYRFRTTRPNIGYYLWALPKERKGTSYAAAAILSDNQVYQLVQEGLVRHSTGLVIVYASSIHTVQRLGSRLGCATYHSKVGTPEEKAAIVRTWVSAGSRETGKAQPGSQPGSRVVVATNALGMGIDIPYIRLVVHAEPPSRLQDYVQESGRAGRDGLSSEAVCLLPYNTLTSATSRLEHTMQEYLAGKSCRRVVLDRVMDGLEGRAGCGEGEMACDVCQPGVLRTLLEGRAESRLPSRTERTEEEEGEGEVLVSSSHTQDLVPTAAPSSSHLLAVLHKSAITRTSQPQPPPPASTPAPVLVPDRRDAQVLAAEMAAIDGRLRAAMGGYAVAERVVRLRSMQEGRDLEALWVLLESWESCCALCRFHPANTGRSDDPYASMHAAGECPFEGSAWAREFWLLAGFVRGELYTRNKFQKFSGCFGCGLPQAVCPSWERQCEESSLFVRVIDPERRCWGPGVLVQTFVGLLLTDRAAVLGALEERFGVGEAVVQAVQEMEVCTEGGRICVQGGGDRTRLWAWFGKRKMWCNHESNHFCMLVTKLNTLSSY